MRLTLLLFVLAVVLGVFTLTSCASIGYYSQAIGGQLDLLRKARPVDEVIADQRQPEDLRQKLQVARAARQFSQRELKLPRNRSYQSYVDLGRRAVVWNVIATPAYSVAPLQWCYPVAGCFSYRGYFSRREAERYAADLRARGFDVYVAGATAYSTLGWFDDPILSTMLRRSEPDLVGTIFHELAHQRLHVPGDTAFNEAFAVAVAEEGVRRWYRDRPEVYARYVGDQERLHAVSVLLMETRGRLAALFREPVREAEKAARKRGIFDSARDEYETLKAGWGGDDSFDGWFPEDLNNAHLALTATYQHFVPAFKALLAREGGDLERFYAAAGRLGRLPPAVRREKLAALLAAPPLRTVALER